MKILLFLLVTTNIVLGNIYFYDWGECFFKSHEYKKWELNHQSANKFQDLHKFMSGKINIARLIVAKKMNAQAIIDRSSRDFVSIELDVTEDIIKEVNNDK